MKGEKIKEKAKHFKSVFDNEQELLKAIIQIHSPEGIELDPMYFKGNFYKEIPKPKWCFDINPQVEGVIERNATSLPFSDGFIKSMILDPPFMFGKHGKARDYYSSKTHGIFENFDDLYVCYDDILKEAYRILKKGGILIFKCQDYTDSKTTMTHCIVYLLATKLGFYAKDLAILNLPKNKICNNKLTQRHLRKVHSYFWVFRRD